MAIVFKTPISALNTTTKDIQNIKQGDCPPCPEPVVESTSEEYTSNGEYTLTPEEGVDGFSQVEITVNVPSDVNNQNKDVTISQNGEQTISADSGYTGLGEVSVTVAVDVETPYNEGYAAGEIAGIATGKAEGIAEQKAKLTSTTITENGTTTREDGWNSVTVNVDVTTPYNNGVAAGEAAQKAKLTSGTFVSNGTYTREDGYNSVTVNVPSDINNQDKTVDPSTSQQTVSADNGYSGLGQVTVNAVTASIDRNIQPENIVDGVTILGVTGDVFVPTLEEGTYAPEFIGTTTVEPRIEGNGFSSVEITVPTQPIGSTNNPFDNIQTVLDTDFEKGCYYDEITSGGIDKTTGYYDAVANDGTVFHIKPYLNNPDYDPELRPEDQPDVPEFIFPEDFDLAGKNIIVWFNKANVSQINNQAKAPLLRSAIIYEFNDCDLFAINYNFEPTTWPFGTLDVTENGTVDPTGYAEIDVNVQPTLQTKSVIPSDRQQVITPDRDYDGLSEVTVSGVTAAIDQNITASNIKDGVTILGVTGTYDPQPNLQSKSVNPTTSAQTVSPDSGYDGLSQVSVTAVTSAIDANIAAGNIKDGVTILGITGTYDPQPSLESKTASYTANGTYTITPSTGYDGMSDVEVTVNVSGGSGTQCPDWSSIGWDCNDVAASGIDADLAYTAQKKAEFEGGTITSFHNDNKLVFAPMVQINSGIQFGSCTSLRYVPLFDTSSVTNMANMFSNCSNLATVPLFNTSNVTNMQAMFSSCSKLESVPLFDTSKLTNMQAMFSGCTKLTSIPAFDTSNVTNMSGTFQGGGPYNLMSIQSYPAFDTSSVTNMSNCFSNNSFTTAPTLNTSNVTNMSNMFTNCVNLTTIPLYNTSKVSNINGMFYGCSSLTTIPQFDFSNVTSVSDAFGNCTNLTTIPILNFEKAAGTISLMFRSCTSLTDLGGFVNIGKSFNQVGNNSILDLSASSVLTYQSIMNVINNLATPDDTRVNPTLKLSAASYALLTEEDIAIATAKRWSVVSA